MDGIIDKLIFPSLYNYQCTKINNRQMSIVQVEKKPIVKLSYIKRKSWHAKFRKNIYLANYSKYFKKESYEDLDMFLEQKKNQSAQLITKIVRNQNMSQALFKINLAFDNQIREYYYSPYSVIIPLKDQSFLNDELINTFPYLSQIVDGGKRDEAMKYYIQATQLFKNAKTDTQSIESSSLIQQQWAQLKSKCLCNFDTIRAVMLYMQILKTDSDSIQKLYAKYGKKAHKEIFIWRITRCSKYIKSSLKVHQNIQISVQIKDQINQKTLPLVMKTWYCPLCISYDCEKHKLQNKVSDHGYQYISQKNKKSSLDHIKSIVNLFKFYESLKNEEVMSDIQLKNGCNKNCYKLLNKSELIKFMRYRHKLISPLAKSLVKMGIQLFSYNPCFISNLFQSKHDEEINSISCSQIFLYFVQQSNLLEKINKKMYKQEREHLKNESDKLIDVEKLKIPINQPKIKKNTAYIDKRFKNATPELACCMHTFIDSPQIDPKCQKCVCRQRGFCLPSCLCTQSCEIKRLGCICQGFDCCKSEKCLCFINQLQCQPGICSECFEVKHRKINCCQNDQIIRGFKKRVLIGLSNIPGAGLGAFAGENYAINDLVCIYSGQHINSDVDSIRQLMIKDLSFYNFDSPNGKTINASIDARFMGNKARFINHGNENQENLKSLTVFSNGTQYIGLYALRKIEQGEQLTFNYDGSGNLYKHHRQKYPFIKPRSKQD